MSHPIPSIVPTVTWLKKPAIDVLTAIESVVDTSGDYTSSFNFKAETPDTFLSWAIQEVKLAEKNPKDQSRHCTQAVGHVKRAFDCLFDAYIKRDWLECRLSKTSAFKEKLNLLSKRPGLRVPINLIPEIITSPRDTVEHEFTVPTLAETQLACEAAESVFSFLQQQLSPIHTPVIRGFFAHGMSSHRDGTYSYYFEGFSGPLAMTWKGSDGITRVCAVVTNGKANAEVIWCEIKELNLEQHYRLIEYWQSNGSRFGQGETHVRELMKLTKLDQP